MVLVLIVRAAAVGDARPGACGVQADPCGGWPGEGAGPHLLPALSCSMPRRTRQVKIPLCTFPSLKHIWLFHLEESSCPVKLELSVLEGKTSEIEGSFTNMDP